MATSFSSYILFVLYFNIDAEKPFSGMLNKVYVCMYVCIFVPRVGYVIERSMLIGRTRINALYVHLWKLTPLRSLVTLRDYRARVPRAG